MKKSKADEAGGEHDEQVAITNGPTTKLLDPQRVLRKVDLRSVLSISRRLLGVFENGLEFANQWFGSCARHL
jgi:hypothetical protein